VAQVHGYSGAETWGNLLVNKHAELIYFTAAVVVVQPPLHDDSGELGGQVRDEKGKTTSQNAVFRPFFGVWSEQFSIF
jgi:hypothetical protein